MKRLVKFAAGSVNLAAFTAMVAVGAYSIKEASAEAALRTVTDNDRYCLQQNIYFEARNQSTTGQVAVAWVTLNRMSAARYPDTICDVVWQNRQFSWTHDGKSDKPGKTVLEQRAWEDAGLVAEVVLLDWARERTSPVDNATMFHATWMDKAPYWASSYNKVVIIDDHIFYTEDS